MDEFDLIEGLVNLFFVLAFAIVLAWLLWQLFKMLFLGAG